MEINDSEFLSMFFSDETAAFRSPVEPEPGETVSVRIRVPKDCASRVLLNFSNGSHAVLMTSCGSSLCFEYYEAKIVCLDEEITYYFEVECRGEIQKVIYNKLGASFKDEKPDEEYSFRFTPGFHVPDWAKGALQYQIFPDRFCNGNPDNDVCDNEYYYAVGHSKHISNWDTSPDDTDIRCFYGGDLQGIMSKLDYLQSLGVEVIYLNPIFISPSSHKYDVQDYDHIDPHLAIICDDLEHSMQDWEKHNGYAPRYIRRVTSKANLKASDDYFASFCQELHRRGMKIILDGVFNHCGSFNKWMDREGIYLGKPGYENGAYQDNYSPYREYFRFKSGSSRYADYEGWWGHVTLPKLNYEDSLTLRERIFAIAEKWAMPPYSIDGWRLDVAADLGHSLEFNHGFWQEFRTRLKNINPQLLIIAEHYGNPSDWLHGDQWDTVMNYDAFMEPLSFFLTGMEKHSNEYCEELYRDGKAFFENMLKNMAAFEEPSLYSAMNQLSNHDHSRFLTRTNRKAGRLTTLGSEAAGIGINKAVFREAICVQMTWPGAPTIYYGDEAGQLGWTDPDNRRTYPWGHEDEMLIEYHRSLSAIRNEFPVLKSGSLKPLYGEYGSIAYARFDEKSCAIVACNNTDEAVLFTLHTIETGTPDGTEYTRVLISDGNGFSTEREDKLSVENGRIEVRLPPLSVAIYTANLS